MSGNVGFPGYSFSNLSKQNATLLITAKSHKLRRPVCRFDWSNARSPWNLKHTGNTGEIKAAGVKGNSGVSPGDTDG